MSKTKRIVIVGATSSIAQACAKFWLSEKSLSQLILIARNQEKLMIIASDLKTRNPNVQIKQIVTDLTDPNSIEKSVNVVFENGHVDIVLIAQGSLVSQSDSTNDMKVLYEEFSINSLSPILFAQAFFNRLKNSDRKSALAVIGSVAGDRIRKSNYTYGAAKLLLEHYIKALRNLTEGSGVRVILIKPGPTFTKMTAKIKLGIGMADVNEVAKIIVDGIHLGKPIIYAPKIWFYIMLVIKMIPNLIFNKLNL